MINFKKDKVQFILNFFKNIVVIGLFISLSGIYKAGAIATKQNYPLNGLGYEMCDATCACGQSICYSSNGTYHTTYSDSKCLNYSGYFYGYIIGGSPSYAYSTCGDYQYYTTCSVTCSTTTFCGDGVCNGTETNSTCPGDCPSSNDGTTNCTPIETKTCSTFQPAWYSKANYGQQCQNHGICYGDPAGGDFVQFTGCGKYVTRCTTTVKCGNVCDSGCTPTCQCNNLPESSPAAPTSLVVKSCTTSTCAATTFDKSKLSSLIFTWSNGTNWGVNCPANVNKNTLLIENKALGLVIYATGPSNPFTTKTINFTTATGAVKNAITCNGAYTWTVTKDNGAFSASTAAIFNITGFSSPGLSITGISTDLNKAITVTGIASSPSGITSITTSIKDSLNNIVDTNTTTYAKVTSQSYSWTSTALTGGTYQAVAQASDSCGVLASASSATISIPTSPPPAPLVPSVDLTSTITAGQNVIEGGTGIFTATTLNANSATINLTSSTLGIVGRQTCTTSPCVLNYTAVCGQGSITATAQASNLSGTVVDATPISFTVVNTYNLTANIYKFNSPLGTSDAPNCSSSDKSSYNATETIQLTNGIDTVTATQSGSLATFSNVPESLFNVTPAIISTGGLDPACKPSITKPATACGTSSVGDIIFAERREKAWVQVIDGDVYTKSFNLSNNSNLSNTCLAPTFMNPQTMNSYVISGNAPYLDNSYLYSTTTTSSGYVKNLTDNKVIDRSFTKMSFPTNTTNLTSISSLSSINNNKDKYIIYEDLTIDNFGVTVNTGGTGVVVYVNGNITISGDIKITGGGSVVLIAKGGITITPGVGTLPNSTTCNITTASTPNIKAGLVSLDKTNGIKFSSYGTGINDNVVIVEGFLVTKGPITFNRDLGDAGNKMYPSVIVKYDGNLLYKLSKILNSETRTVSIKWLYE